MCARGPRDTGHSDCPTIVTGLGSSNAAIGSVAVSRQRSGATQQL